jgi:hypothetical protein
MTKQTALDAFLARKVQIDAMLAKLTELSNDHFDVSPDEIHWGHVGDLGRTAHLLTEVVSQFTSNPL